MGFFCGFGEFFLMAKVRIEENMRATKYNCAFLNLD